MRVWKQASEQLSFIVSALDSASVSAPTFFSMICCDQDVMVCISAIEPKLGHLGTEN